MEKKVKYLVQVKVPTLGVGNYCCYSEEELEQWEHNARVNGHELLAKFIVKTNKNESVVSSSNS